MFRCSALLWVVTALSASLAGGHGSVERSAPAEVGDVVYLKTHEQAFGRADYGDRTGRRIFQVEALFRDGQFRVGGDPDWRSRYFVTWNPYRIRTIRRAGDGLEIKLASLSRQTELKLRLGPLKRAWECFFLLFARGMDEGVEYEREVNRQLAARYLEPHLGAVTLSAARERQLVELLKRLSAGPHPEIEIRQGLVYAGVELGDVFSCRGRPTRCPFFSRRTTTAAQRVSSSLRKAIGLLANRLAGTSSEEMALIHGFLLHWDSLYRTYESETPPQEDRLQLRVARDALTRYRQGRLSLPEMVEQSFLLLNGRHYQLKFYQPGER